MFGSLAETWSSCAVPRSGIGNNRVSRIRYCWTGKLHRGFEEFFNVFLNGQMMRSLDSPPNYGMRKSSLLKGYVRLYKEGLWVRCWDVC